MEEIIPNGREVIIFFYPSNDSTSTRLESPRTFKGRIISSRESEDLSYHGSAYVSNFFIRTIEHYKKNYRINNSKL